MTLLLQRFALAPASEPDATVGVSTPDPNVMGQIAWGSWLANAGLGAWWQWLVSRRGALGLWQSPDIDALRLASRSAAATYLLQRDVLRRTALALDAAGIDYLVFKGAHVREWLYDEPSVRTSGDIDILVSFTDRLLAIVALQRSGFALRAIAEIASHEVQLISNNVQVDLHWDVMRPGRTRTSMVKGLLERRVQLNGSPVPCAEDTALLMLIQPAFADHVSGPTMPLIRALDFYLLTQRVSVDWDRVVQAAAILGVKTAAWTTLQWFLRLNGKAVRLDDRVIDAMAPSGARAAYLRYWLEHDLPLRTHRLPGFAQLAFTLAMHDTGRDAARATYMAVQARLRPDAEVLALGEAHP